MTRPGLAVFLPFKNEPDEPLEEVVVGNSFLGVISFGGEDSFGMDSERRVVDVGAGVGGGASGMGSFLGVTVAGLLVVRVGGGESFTLGGVYLRVLVVEDLLWGVGAGGVLLLGLGLGGGVDFWVCGTTGVFCC